MVSAPRAVRRRFNQHIMVGYLSIFASLVRKHAGHLHGAADITFTSTRAGLSWLNRPREGRWQTHFSVLLEHLRGLSLSSRACIRIGIKENGRYQLCNSTEVNIATILSGFSRMPHSQYFPFSAFVHCIASPRPANCHASWVAVTFRFATDAEISAVVSVVFFSCRLSCEHEQHAHSLTGAAAAFDVKD